MKYFATKLLNLEIRDINFHIKFIEKNLNVVKEKITLSTLDSVTMEKFFLFTSNKFKSMHEKFDLIHIKKLASVKSNTCVNSNKNTWLKNLTAV